MKKAYLLTIILDNKLSEADLFTHVQLPYIPTQMISERFMNGKSYIKVFLEIDYASIISICSVLEMVSSMVELSVLELTDDAPHLCYYTNANSPAIFYQQNQALNTQLV